MSFETAWTVLTRKRRHPNRVAAFQAIWYRHYPPHYAKVNKLTSFLIWELVETVPWARRDISQWQTQVTEMTPPSLLERLKPASKSAIS